MNKTVQILLVVTGVGLLIWFISKMQTKQGQTVVVPTTASTGTAGLLDQFFPAFRRMNTPSVGIRYDSTGEKIKAISGAVGQIPGVLKGFGDLFSSWKSPASTPITTTAASGDYSSYEDYYGVGGWEA